MDMRDFELLPTFYVYVTTEAGIKGHTITLAVPLHRKPIFSGSFEECMKWSGEKLLSEYRESKREANYCDNQMAMDFGMGRMVAND